jgi:pimeloyl-ACP methyl ester carboxylesterase
MEWGLALGLVLALPVALYFMQDRLLFHQRPVTETTRALIAQSSPGVESVFIRAADGTRLHAWYRKGSPLVIYFGGNAEEVSWMLARVARNAPGTGWLLVDYRGYGSSEGAPSEQALIKDGMQWYALAKEKLAAQNIVLFGRSLGSGVAVQIAAAHPVAGVILVAPYDSLTSVAQHYYPFLPVSWMLKHPFDSLQHVPGITVPLLCLVAGRDEVIPIVHSKRLFDAWKGPRRWVELEGAGHNSTDDAPAFWQAIREFLVQPS